jgi:hypothetical protein
MYAEASTVRDARASYFESNGFSDAGYNDDWVHLKVLGIPVAIPNTRSRKRAVPLHDLHHVATGYSTSLIGEAEIGAWEIGGGCTSYWAAWVLNGLGFTYGVVLAPRRIYRAFVRGRHSRTLYHTGWQDELLDVSVGELRERLGLDQPITASWRDRVAFVGWIALAFAPWAAAAAAVLSLVR